jgi:hypothetical protein
MKKETTKPLYVFEPAFTNILVDFVRVFVLGAIGLLLYFYKINPNGSVIASSILLIFLIFTIKTKIKVFEDSIAFETNRIFPFMGNKIRFYYRDINNFTFYQEPVGPLLIFLSKVIVVRSAEFNFDLKDGTYRKWNLSMNNAKALILKKIIEEKISQSI